MSCAVLIGDQHLSAMRILYGSVRVVKTAQFEDEFPTRERGFGHCQWLNLLCPIFVHSQLNCLPFSMGTFFARPPAPLLHV